jgi:hypothetical protein
MNDPLLNDPLPEQRIAKVVRALETLNPELSERELAAALSPYIKLERLEAKSEERTLCLGNFYDSREKLVQRERDAFQERAELIAEIMLRPEARFMLGNSPDPG